MSECKVDRANSPSFSTSQPTIRKKKRMGKVKSIGESFRSAVASQLKYVVKSKGDQPVTNHRRRRTPSGRKSPENVRLSKDSVQTNKKKIHRTSTYLSPFPARQNYGDFHSCLSLPDLGHRELIMELDRKQSLSGVDRYERYINHIRKTSRNKSKNVVKGMVARLKKEQTFKKAGKSVIKKKVKSPRYRKKAAESDDSFSKPKPYDSPSKNCGLLPLSKDTNPTANNYTFMNFFDRVNASDTSTYADSDLYDESTLDESKDDSLSIQQTPKALFISVADLSRSPSPTRGDPGNGKSKIKLKSPKKGKYPRKFTSFDQHARDLVTFDKASVSGMKRSPAMNFNEHNLTNNTELQINTNSRDSNKARPGSATSIFKFKRNRYTLHDIKESTEHIQQVISPDQATIPSEQPYPNDSSKIPSLNDAQEYDKNETNRPASKITKYRKKRSEAKPST